jgi:hypothetical protein
MVAGFFCTSSCRSICAVLTAIWLEVRFRSHRFLRSRWRARFECFGSRWKIRGSNVSDRYRLVTWLGMEPDVSWCAISRHPGPARRGPNHVFGTWIPEVSQMRYEGPPRHFEALSERRPADQHVLVGYGQGLQPSGHRTGRGRHYSIIRNSTCAPSGKSLICLARLPRVLIPLTAAMV